MKRFTAFMLALFLVLQMTGCNTSSGLFHQEKDSESSTQKTILEDEDIKVGFLFSNGADAPDTISHMECVRKMQKNTGLKDSQILIVKNVGKDQYRDEIEKLIGKGCDLIFAKASAAEPAMIEAARDHPEVEFCQEDGREVSESGLSNIHSFYVRLYEGYYAAGVAAGCKLNDMLNRGKITPDQCVIGFAATRENPENLSCINAFYLGVQEVCTQASVLVRYVDGSGKYDDDNECARQLIGAGAHMMSQRVFTTAAAAACAENDIPIVGNEINIIDVAPNEAITSVTADWSIYYEYAARSLVEGKDIAPDWVAGYEENAVGLSQFNDAHLPEDAIIKVADTEKDLRKGKAKVFDTGKFKIDGSAIEDLIKNDKSYSKYKPYVSKGEFKESRKQSVPVMEFLIDGISVSTENYLPEEESTETTESEDSN